jgi:hypothetical protein
MGAILDWAAITLPTFLALAGVLVSIETPKVESNRIKWAIRAALLAFGILVSVVTALQQQGARSDTDTIKHLLADIATMLKLDPSSPPGEILKRLESNEAQLAALANPPRALDVLYLDKRPIARVVGIGLSADQKTVSFQGVTSEREIDFSKEMELQNVRLRCTPQQVGAVVTFGAAQSFTYNGVVCSLLANTPR